MVCCFLSAVVLLKEILVRGSSRRFSLARKLCATRLNYRHACIRDSTRIVRILLPNWIFLVKKLLILLGYSLFCWHVNSRCRKPSKVAYCARNAGGRICPNLDLLTSLLNTMTAFEKKNSISKEIVVVS